MVFLTTQLDVDKNSIMVFSLLDMVHQMMVRVTLLSRTLGVHLGVIQDILRSVILHKMFAVFLVTQPFQLFD